MQHPFAGYHPLALASAAHFTLANRTFHTSGNTSAIVHHFNDRPLASAFATHSRLPNRSLYSAGNNTNSIVHQFSNIPLSGSETGHTICDSDTQQANFVGDNAVATSESQIYDLQLLKRTRESTIMRHQNWYLPAGESSTLGRRQQPVYEMVAEPKLTLDTSCDSGSTRATYAGDEVVSGSESQIYDRIYDMPRLKRTRESTLARQQNWSQLYLPPRNMSGFMQD